MSRRWIVAEIEISTMEDIDETKFTDVLDQIITDLENSKKIPEMGIGKILPLPVSHGYWVEFSIPSRCKRFRVEYLDCIKKELSKRIDMDAFELTSFWMV